MEISEMRKRVRAAIDHSQRLAAARRAEIDQAATAYETFLAEMAEPIVQMLANALRGEGYSFKVFTPKHGLRLVSSRSDQDFIEFGLDTARHPVAVLRISRTRGRRVMQHERTIRGEEQIDQLTEEDVVKALLEEIGPLVER